ncbi:hypothetical protein HGRIS_011098 [Hohenbuehelia grisea]|uniref:Uncharacterized protein n=1 Tax=Hohenbuehelia grisea TaxID=104357 RepID=A0ABR3IYU0_9AGAR
MAANPGRGKESTAALAAMWKVSSENPRNRRTAGPTAAIVEAPTLTSGNNPDPAEPTKDGSDSSSSSSACESDG